jgi:hypothetical protein
VERVRLAAAVWSYLPRDFDYETKRLNLAFASAITIPEGATDQVRDKVE